MSHSIQLPLLLQLGLNESESLVYELLLQQGPQTGLAITKSSGLTKGVVYNALALLREKNLVEEQKGKKKIFAITSPESLQSIAQSLSIRAQALQTQVESLLPTLHNQYLLTTNRPTLRIAIGLEQVKNVYLEFLTKKDPLYSLIGIEEIDTTLLHWLDHTWVSLRRAKQIPSTVVYSNSKGMNAYSETHTKSLRKTIFVSHEKFPFEGEVLIGSDRVALIQTHGDLMATVLESKALAKTLRSTVLALQSLSKTSG